MREDIIKLFNAYMNKIISDRYNHNAAHGDYLIIRKYMTDLNKELLFEDKKHLDLFTKYEKSKYITNKFRPDIVTKKNMFDYYDKHVKIDYEFIDNMKKYIDDLNKYLNRINPKSYVDRSNNNNNLIITEYIVKDLNGYKNASRIIKENLKTIVEYTWIYLRYFKHIPVSRLKQFKVTNISLSKTFVLVVEMTDMSKNKEQE